MEGSIRNNDLGCQWNNGDNMLYRFLMIMDDAKSFNQIVRYKLMTGYFALSY